MHHSVAIQFRHHMVLIKAHRRAIDHQGPLSMKTTAHIAILSLAAIATVIAPLSSAEARKRFPRYHGNHHRAAIIGATALTAGVIIGSHMSRPRVHRRAVIVDRGPVYVAPRYVDPGYDVDQPIYDAPDYSDDQAYDNQGQDEDLLYGQDDEGDYAGRQDDQGDNDYYPAKPRQHADRDQVDEGQDTAGALEPWSAEWKAYCSERYRTFDPRKGTYHGVDGRDHFCVAG